MKKLSELAQGAHFLYGGVEWVKFEDIGAGTLCLAAEPVFLRAFDEENCNDWRKSSLRRELNGAFLDALVAEGADRAAFLDCLAVRRAVPEVSGHHPARGRVVLEPDPVDVRRVPLLPRPQRLFLRRFELVLCVQRRPGRSPDLLSEI